MHAGYFMMNECAYFCKFVEECHESTSKSERMHAVPN